MPELSPEFRRLRAQYAAAMRHHPNDDHRELRERLEAAAWDSHLRQIIDALSGAITPEQKQKLSALLAPGQKPVADYAERGMTA